MQVGFFDGHAEALSAEECTDVRYYVPSGSTVGTSAAGKLTINQLNAAKRGGNAYLYPNGSEIR